MMLPVRESCEDKLEVLGVLVADFWSVYVLDVLTVFDSGEVFFGEYH